ncbi:MAG: NAD(P)-dependent alcohol dehydrogenase [Planctomycetota bacterium]|jgi:NADPH:quinone reductase-like Zn-dependent oxidoreductase
MRAIVRDEYGPPEVLRVEDLPNPTPGEGELLVAVRAASVAKGDWEILRGTPAWVRISGFGFRRPKHRVLGYNFAGVVEAVGAGVERFDVGDEVVGDVLTCGLGAFAEFVRVPETAPLVHKPPGVSFEDAASVPEAGFIALQALRDKADVQAGQRVLVNGGGGGAGSFAIQLAKSRGAEVTGVDRAEKLDWMRSLGADHVVDCARQDFGGHDSHYDFVLDVVGARSIRSWKRMLRPGGLYLAAGGSVSYILKTLLFGAWASLAGGKRVAMLAVRPNQEDLRSILALLESGAVAATIDRRYPLEEVPDAIRYLGEGRSKGKLVIVV